METFVDGGKEVNQGDTPDLAMPSPCADGMYQLAPHNEQGLDLSKIEVLVNGRKNRQSKGLAAS